MDKPKIKHDLKRELHTLIDTRLGQVSVIFMSQKIKGTEMIMPTEELMAISDEIVNELWDKWLT